MPEHNLVGWAVLITLVLSILYGLIVAIFHGKNGKAKEKETDINRKKTL